MMTMRWWWWKYTDQIRQDNTYGDGRISTEAVTPLPQGCWAPAVPNFGGSFLFILLSHNYQIWRGESMCLPSQESGFPAMRSVFLSSRGCNLSVVAPGFVDWGQLEVAICTDWDVTHILWFRIITKAFYYRGRWGKVFNCLLYPAP